MNTYKRKKIVGKTKVKLGIIKPNAGDLLRISNITKKRANTLLHRKLQKNAIITLNLLLNIIKDSNKYAVPKPISMAIHEHIKEVFAYLHRNSIGDFTNIKNDFIKLQKSFEKLINCQFPIINRKITIDDKLLLTNFIMPKIAITLTNNKGNIAFDIHNKNNILALKIFAQIIAYLDKDFTKFDRDKTSYITKWIKYILENTNADYFKISNQLYLLLHRSLNSLDPTISNTSLHICLYAVNTLKTNGDPQNLKALLNFLKREVNNDKINRDPTFLKHIDSILSHLDEKVEIGLKRKI